MARYGLIVDISRCTGCYACVVACKSENSTRPEVSWIRIEEEEQGEYPQVSRRYIPLLCMQCGEMPCAQACPSEAIFMGAEGIVHIEPDKCLCHEAHPCIAACPFEVLQVNKGKKSYFLDDPVPFAKEAYEAHRDGVVEKCTLCSHRISVGRLPACVQACPTRAILFGDHDDPNSDLAKFVSGGRAQDLRKGLKLNPSVVYIK